MFKKLAVLAAALALFTPTIALAQDAPPPADAPPSYARPADQSPDEQIRGRVISFDGGYALTVQDERGYQDSVQLHQGTIINPTGITLAPGMTVSILGYNAGSYFAANEIDTPYQIEGGVPYFYGHPYFYYGPSFSLDFFFGAGGWWHPEYFGGGYRYVGGARFYNSVRASNFVGGYVGGYRGGYTTGGAYRAPLGNGAYRPSHYGSAPGGQRFEQSRSYAAPGNAYRGSQNAYRGSSASGSRATRSAAHATSSGSHGGGSHGH